MTDAPSPAGAGPIALVGSGEFLPAMEAVDAALLAGRPARAVFLPTAAGEEGPDRVAYWLRLGTDHYRRLGAEPVPLAVLDRRDADDEKLAAQVEGAGLIYLSGGNPGYLADTLRGTAVLDAILGAWRDGAALAGCSAGAWPTTPARALPGRGWRWCRASSSSPTSTASSSGGRESWPPGPPVSAPDRPWSGSTRRLP
jgi:hypothetical protein